MELEDNFEDKKVNQATCLHRRVVRIGSYMVNPTDVFISAANIKITVPAVNSGKLTFSEFSMETVSC